MKRITRILLATDFSDTAAAALQWAMAIADRHGATITLVHAVETIGSVTLPLELQDEVESGLAELERRVRDAGIAVERSYHVGRSWQVIAEAEQSAKPDLIVLGSRGHTAYTRLLLGSTPDRVIRHATSPVLTVHPDDASDASSIGTILVATDFSDEAAEAARMAWRLLDAQEGGGRLVLLHVWYPPVEYDFDSGAHLVATDPGLTAEASRIRLEAMAGGLREGGVEVEVAAREGYPASVIHDEIGAAGADLVALGTHGRSGLKHMLLGSVAERVLHHATCPVLTVRAR